MTPIFPRHNQGVVLWNTSQPTQVTPTGLSPSTAGHSRPLRLPWVRPKGGSKTLHPPSLSRGVRFGLFPFRSPLLRESHFDFFSSPYLDVSVRGVPVPYGTPKAINLWQEVPFGNLRIKGCMHLPGAFRRLPRPSSAPEPSHPPTGVGVSGPDPQI